MRTILLCLTLAVTLPAFAERIHIVIPAGPGGGLDTTARSIGDVLMQTQADARVSYENRSGGGGGKAMAYVVESGASLTDTLLVNSTPLLVRSLQGLFPHSFRDVIPVAGLIADPAVVAVRADSKFADWPAIAAELAADSRKVTVGGGSVRGSLDHIVTSLLAREIGIDPRLVRYLPYDGGGKAMLALLGGEVEVLVSGFGETIAQHTNGSVRIVAVASADRNPQLPEVPTFTELDTRLVFANWRGLFAPPGSSDEAINEYQDAIERAVASDQWRAKIEQYGWQAQYLRGPDFAEYLQQQEVTLREVLTELGLIR